MRRFRGLTNREVADVLRRDLPGSGALPDAVLAASDPFVVLAHAHQLGAAHGQATEQHLTVLETRAVASAPPTPRAHATLRELVNRGHVVTVVSNNSTAAIRAYLERHQLADVVAGIAARVKGDPALLKPNPHLLHEAMRQRVAEPAGCVMVGDSVTDVEVARAAGVAVIAYVNKPGKHATFTALRPDAIVADMGTIPDLITPA